MFNNNELKNIEELYKLGLKSVNITGDALIVLGNLLKKIENLQKIQPKETQVTGTLEVPDVAKNK